MKATVYVANLLPIGPLTSGGTMDAPILHVGSAVHYKTEPGTVVSLASQARHGFPNRVIRVAFSDDTLVFGRGKDGQYRAAGTPLDSPHTLNVETTYTPGNQV